MSEQKTETTTATGTEAAKTEQTPFPMKAILGQKVGMTQIFNETGKFIPVSVIVSDSCVTSGIKTVETDGYNAVQLAYGQANPKHVTKPFAAQFQKKNITAPKWLKEFRVADAKKFQVGQKVSVDVFKAGDYVDISGISKGKGFAGVKKRHNFGGLPTSHGASDKVNSRGSSGGGSGQPQRVFKGTRMAGRMGTDKITVQNLEVVEVDPDKNLLVVRGCVPGANGGIVVVRKSVKKKFKKGAS